MFDYYLGGKDNFAADREAAEQVMRIIPGAAQSARESRRFLRRAVSFLAGEEGITQFLDIGVGLPTQGAVHEIAQEFSPSVRVVYVDHDPIVVSHAEVLLAEADVAAVVRGDLRRPKELLSMPGIRDFLDFSQPIAVILQLIVHFIADADDPAGIIATLRDAVVPGSYLVLSHVSPDALSTEAARQAGLRAVSVYQEANEPMIPRSRAQIERFFNGWDLVEPGLVPKSEWRPAAGVPGGFDVSLAGVARRP